MANIKLLWSIVVLFYATTIYGFEYPCTYTTSSGGDFYDLSPLSKCDNTGYTVGGDNGFVINVCNTVNGCSNQAAASCQGGGYDTGNANSGSFSDHPSGSASGVVLTYTGGDNGGCSQDRQTIITFTCDQTATTPVWTFTSENPQCVYNIAVSSAYACPVSAAPQINTCPVNVFLVPHTHDDVGWTDTVEGYYDSEVRNILNTVLECLVANPDRKFIYVEQAYFWRWWTDGNVTDQQRSDFRKIYANGQFEFVIGGWVMQDEACTTYTADIDQMTLGHQFLLNEFGAQPSKGWQLDPFGASSVTSTLQKLAGFDAHLIDRVSNKDVLEANQMIQFNWRGSPSLGAESELFTEIMYGNTVAYCDWLSAFNFESNPINSGNVDQYAQTFISMVQQRQPSFKTPNILAAWGCDFAFQNAGPLFDGMDYLLNYLKTNYSDMHINIQYATVSDYFAAVKQSAVQNSVSFPTNLGDDFLPLNEGCYWTGYYTSRTQLKGYVRDGEAVSHLAEPLFSVAKYFPIEWDYATAYDQLFTLRLANADAQHHDGVTGTSIPQVVLMYGDDLNSGISSAFSAIETIVGTYLIPNNTVPVPGLSHSNEALLNLSSSSLTPVVIYNSLAWTRIEYVVIPVNSDTASVFDSNMSEVPSQVNPNYLGNAVAKNNLYFEVTIPPFGFSTYFVSPNASSLSYSSEIITIQQGEDKTISNTFLQVTISGSTGRISNITNTQSSRSVSFDQELKQYISENSGAYCFGSTGASQSLSSSPVPKSIFTSGPLVSEIFQVFPCDMAADSYAKQNIRIYTSSSSHTQDIEDFVELSFEIGQLPSSTEIIASFETSIDSRQVFSTDDNGFEFLERVSSYTHSIPGNYYPLIYSGFIKDDISQFTVISERSHGASSLTSGQFEVMLHRNPDMGDGFGPGLTDTTTVFPALRLIVDSPQNSKLPARRQPLLLNFPLVAMSSYSSFSVDEWKGFYKTDGTFLESALPDNVHLVSLNTLSPASDSAVVFRLTHMFAVGEHPELSKPVDIDLSKIFSTVQLSHIAESTLTANRFITNLTSTVITLEPKQIRTFVAEISSP